jgi:hypothetical protein
VVEYFPNERKKRRRRRRREEVEKYSAGGAYYFFCEHGEGDCRGTRLGGGRSRSYGTVMVSHSLAMAVADGPQTHVRAPG